MMLRLFGASLEIGVLSACSSSLVEKAEGMKPGDDRLFSSLHAEYIALGKAENDESDFLDADHFSSKAITTGGGKAVGSDPVESHKLSTGTAVAQRAAEKRISKALKGGTAEYAPDQMVKAQAIYGGWLQEQEKNT